MSDSFNWCDNPEIVQREVPAVAVYTNIMDQVVIRQERSWDEDDDTVIRIDPANALRVARAIIRAAGLADGDVVAVGDQQPKDRTGAERQRRHRNRNQDAQLLLSAAAPVTGRYVTGQSNGHAVTRARTIEGSIAS